MTQGRLLIGVILSFTIFTGGGLWYFTQIAHYQQVNNVNSIMIADQPIEVREYKGLDGDSSPLKLRACFILDLEKLPTISAISDASPLLAPRWFDCFDAQQISSDLKMGKANVILSTKNQPFGFDKYIAYYPNGQAYMWRQLNICGNLYFAGQAMPADCPDPNQESAAKRVMINPNSDLFTLKLTPKTNITPQEMSISGNPKIAASSNGHNFHACFHTPTDIAILRADYKIEKTAIAHAPRGNFPCFNAKKINADIINKQAIALLGQRNIVKGYDRIIAVYPNGTAYAWHQRGQYE